MFSSSIVFWAFSPKIKRRGSYVFHRRCQCSRLHSCRLFSHCSPVHHSDRGYQVEDLDLDLDLELGKNRRNGFKWVMPLQVAWWSQKIEAQLHWTDSLTIFTESSCVTLNTDAGCSLIVHLSTVLTGVTRLRTWTWNWRQSWKKKQKDIHSCRIPCMAPIHSLLLVPACSTNSKCHLGWRTHFGQEQDSWWGPNQSVIRAHHWRRKTCNCVLRIYICTIVKHIKKETTRTDFTRNARETWATDAPILQRVKLSIVLTLNWNGTDESWKLLHFRPQTNVDHLLIATKSQDSVFIQCNATNLFHKKFLRCPQDSDKRW